MRHGDLHYWLNEDRSAFDLRMEGSDLAREEGFRTQAIIALLTDGHNPEAGPSIYADTRGWWGDALLPSRIGSKLWTLGRAKLGDETVALWTQYVKEALQFMIDDGQTKSVDVEAWRDRHTLYWNVKIQRPSDSVTYRFYRNWEAQKIGVLYE